MNIYFRKTAVMLLGVMLVILSRVRLDSQESDNPLRLFPLTVGNAWKYEILHKEKKSGTLHVTVDEKYAVKSRWGHPLDVYRLSFNDTFKKKKYRKDILVYYSGLYIYNGKQKESFPFLSLYMRIGDQLGDMLVIDYSKGINFKNKTGDVLTLHHVDRDIIEKYMDEVGLLYFKDNDVEYILKDAVIKKAVNL